MYKEKQILGESARIGIVNRGEAAVRFIRGIKEFNGIYHTRLGTVAFYLDIERESVFVKEADHAYPFSVLPGFKANGIPYLNKNLMLEALNFSQCQAVWPGWGFISENAEFVEMVENAGLVFLGPSSRAMGVLGDKIAAKKLAEEAHVPILPWSKSPLRDVEHARQIAEKLGYPVIIKAAHAGGGRGIRFVKKPEELDRQYNSARDETIRITGGEVLFMEHLVEKGRHLEVQIAADRHGHVQTYGVRDCSVQRRNQKMIEETPPPCLDSETIKNVEEAASRLIKASDYESVGTVEFIYDLAVRQFYFMEVNTRLQVEHPITEQLYGIDLVKTQIQIAMGKELEDKAAPRGSVIEVRLNSEDPEKDFVPAPGRVTLCRMPAGPGIRVDSGIEQGSVIPMEFDSMVAKIIVYGKDRAEALGRLDRALREVRIKVEGGTTNQAFLLELLKSDAMIEGGVHTRFIEEYLQEQSSIVRRNDRDVAIVASAIEQYAGQYFRELINFKEECGKGGYPRQIPSSTGYKITITLEGHTYTFLVKAVGNNIFHLERDGVMVVQYLWRGAEAILIHENKRYAIQIVPRGDILQCEVNGIPYPMELESCGIVRSPSPALVISIAAKPGQTVKSGDLLLTLEAMKMEIIVIAPQSGVVKSLSVRKGEQVAAGQPLLQIDARERDNLSDVVRKPEVSFTRMQTQEVSQRWQILEREFMALFLGYDHSEDTDGLWKEMVSFVTEHPEFKNGLSRLILASLESYVALESLFSYQKIYVEALGQAMSCQELLIHFFRRQKDPEKGIPKKFLDCLERAIRWYRLEGLSQEEARSRSLFRIYKSHSQLKAKQKLLLSILLEACEPGTQTYLFQIADPAAKAQTTDAKTLTPDAKAQTSEKKHPHDELEGRRWADLLDGIALLSQRETPSLADAAIHARYLMFDQIFLKKLQEEGFEKIKNLLKQVVEMGDIESSPQALIQSIIDSGRHLVGDLVKMSCDREKNSRKLALYLLGRYFHRDRHFIGGEWEEKEGKLLYHVHAADSENRYDTVITVLTGENRLTDLAWVRDYVQNTSFETEPEVILLSSESNRSENGRTADNTNPNVEPDTKEDRDLPKNMRDLPKNMQSLTKTGHDFTKQEQDEMVQKIRKNKLRVARWCMIFASPDGALSCRTFMADGEEDMLRRSFDPLFFRELRIFRLANFQLKIVYQSESVSVVLATAKSNPKDERLFAFAEVSETRPELNEDLSIRRIVAFENAFMEAVYAFRAQQARREGRLYWNRIIIHIRSFLQTNLRQIEEYASHLALRAMGIGVERLVLYTRRKAGESIGQEEFIFENISEGKFSLQRREPSRVLLEPMDKYVSKVVRAKQAGTVYPYEIVKMITRGSHTGNQKFPKGDFEEFDIEMEGEKSRAVSVGKRPYGKNVCNVLFGIVTNYSKSQSSALKRVLLLADPTTDMGALAEDECRRVIAALDLAEESRLPVEWIPISAGARIDMNSGTENLDWTARVLKRIIEFTQNGGEINVVVSGINVGAQSYWNAEATMLMHTRGILIMTDEACMLLTGKKALDFSGSVSAENNIGIGGVERIMCPNGEAQIWCKDLLSAYMSLFHHYDFTYLQPGQKFPERKETSDQEDRNICLTPYQDAFDQGFTTIGDIFSKEHNPERKKPFDMRQVMHAVIDQDQGFFERWQFMQEAETAIVWEARLGGFATGMIGIESKPVPRIGSIPHDGPQFWNAGTLFPQSSKKVARAINAFSNRLPLVVLANLSGFDGSPESLRKCQLEFGAEIGRAVVNFKGPIIFVVTGRYHGGAYVVFSRTLNPSLHAVAIEGSYASVIGGAPAAAVVFPKHVLKETYSAPAIVEAQKRMKEDKTFTQKEFDELFQRVQSEKQAAFGQRFDEIHSVERAKKVGSLHDVIPANTLRPYLIHAIEDGMKIR